MSNTGALMLTDAQGYLCLESGCWDFSLQRNFFSERACLSCRLKIRAQQWTWKPTTQVRPKVNTWGDGQTGRTEYVWWSEIILHNEIHAWIDTYFTGFYKQQLADILHEYLRSYPASLKILSTSKPIKGSRYSVQIKRSSHWLTIETPAEQEHAIAGPHISLTNSTR